MNMLLPATNLPRIVVPHKILEKIRQRGALISARKHQEKRKYKGPVVISCKRRDFNHHVGQTYSNFNPQCLASKGWKHRKSVGDHFTINATAGNPSFFDKEDPTDFTQFGFDARLVETLKDMGISHPTVIQGLTFPHIMAGKNVLCAAETGSGKTLAFLLPILQNLHRYKQEYGDKQEMNKPYCIILTPLRELADQIYSVARDMSQRIPFYTQLICGGRGTQNILRNRPYHPTDILITTPGVCTKLFTNNIYDLSRLSHVVFDEVDTLLDDSFSSLSLRILSKLKVSTEKIEGFIDPAVGMQLTMVGATIPRDLDNILGNILPLDSIEMIRTHHLHRIMPHVHQKFERMRPSDKPERLLKAVKLNVRRHLPTIIFCNKSSTVNYLTCLLQDHGVDSIGLHSNMPEKIRSGRFQKFQSGECNIFVCTDLVSRGLDTTRAQHLINYDFPLFVSDYIHRVGRVGRVGSHGSGFALNYISYAWDVDILWKIEASARKMTELYNVNANIKRKLIGIANLRYQKSTNIFHK